MEKSLKDLMIQQIEGYGSFDFYFERGDNNARSFTSYKEWLHSLSNENFLRAYNSIKEVINNLD